MLEEADRLGLPLIGLPDDVSFDDVINQVLTEVLNRQAAVLARSEEAHRALVQIVLTGGGLRPPVRGARRHLRRGRHGHHPRRPGAGQRRRLRAGRATSGCFDGSGRFIVEAEPVGSRPRRAGLHPRRRPHRGRRARPRPPRRVLPDRRDDRRRRAPARAGRDGRGAGDHQGPGGLGGREQVPGRLPARRPGRPGRRRPSGSPATPTPSAGTSTARWWWSWPRPTPTRRRAPSPATSCARLQDRFAPAWARTVQVRDPQAPVVGFSQEVVAVLGVPDDADSDVDHAHGQGARPRGQRRRRRRSPLVLDRGVPADRLRPTPCPRPTSRPARRSRVGRQMHGGVGADALRRPRRLPAARR